MSDYDSLREWLMDSFIGPLHGPPPPWPDPWPPREEDVERAKAWIARERERHAGG